MASALLLLIAALLAGGLIAEARGTLPSVLHALAT